MKKGKVFICGAGPGDPKLMTLRAMELLKTCDVILYDRLVGKEIIDQIPAGSEKASVGRMVGDPTTHQGRTNELMVKYTKKGKAVLRLTGGDPFIFGCHSDRARGCEKRQAGGQMGQACRCGRHYSCIDGYCRAGSDLAQFDKGWDEKKHQSCNCCKWHN